MNESDKVRIFLLNGMSFDVEVPADEFPSWLKYIRSDGGVYCAEMFSRYDAIACIIRGTLLQAAQGQTTGAMPAQRMN